MSCTKHNTVITLTIIPIIILSILTIPGELSGDNIYIPADYADIQSAIDASVTGDIIILTAGTYSGINNRDLDFAGKAITLQSSDPDDPNTVAATIIDCSGTSETNHRGFLFSSSEDYQTVLNGIKIINGYSNSGAAIYCQGSSPTIKNCIIADSTTLGSGGGISCSSDADAIIFNCTITGNTAINYDGGGIACSGSDPNITSCTITDNTAEQYGGGIYFDNASEPYLNAVELSNNTAGDNGGGIFSME